MPRAPRRLRGLVHVDEVSGEAGHVLVHFAAKSLDLRLDAGPPGERALDHRHNACGAARGATVRAAAETSSRGEKSNRGAAVRPPGHRDRKVPRRLREGSEMCRTGGEALVAVSRLPRVSCMAGPGVSFVPLTV